MNDGKLGLPPILTNPIRASRGLPLLGRGGAATVGALAAAWLILLISALPISAEENDVTKYENSLPPGTSDTTNWGFGRIPLGSGGKGDSSELYAPTVVKDGGTYKMWYVGNNGVTPRIYHATSPDALTWTKYDNTAHAISDTVSTNGRIPVGSSGKGDEIQVTHGWAIKDEVGYKFWYTGYGGSPLSFRIFMATSPDGLTWTKYDNSVPPGTSDTTNWGFGRIPLGTAGSGDETRAYAPCVIKDGETYKMWYTGMGGGAFRIFYATSPDALTWTKYDNSIPDPSDTVSTNGRIPLGTAGKGDVAHVSRPSVIKDGAMYRMWYAGQGGGRARIFHATSPDGLTWTKLDNSIPALSDSLSTNGRIPLGSTGKGDDAYCDYPCAIRDGSVYRIWYAGQGSVYLFYYAIQERPPPPKGTVITVF